MAKDSGIEVYRFWAEFVQDPDDASKLNEIDWVEYGPRGLKERTVIVDKVSRIFKTLPEDGKRNPAIFLANLRRKVIEEKYRAWKSGREVTSEGTPLQAWNGISAEQADLVRMAGLSTVEQLASATEAVLSKIRLPSIRTLVKNAALYVDNKDTIRVAGELAKKDEQINLLQEQMEELRRMMLASRSSDDDDEPQPKRRGRPPKAQIDAETEDQEAA